MINKAPGKTNYTILFQRFLLVIGFAAFLHVFSYNIRYIFDQQLKMGYIAHDYKILIFSALMLVLAVCGFIFSGLLLGSNRITNKMYIVTLGFIAFGLRLAFIFLFNSEPISDFQLLYRSAEEVVKGNYGFIKTAPYFLSWVYQIGFVTYQALVIKIFGPGYLALKVLNVVFSSGICILIYLTAKRVFNEKAGRIAGLTYCFFPSSIYMCTVLTNQILSSFLFYLAMYLALGKLKKYSFVLIGLFTALGNIIRPEGPVILAAISAYLLFFKKNVNMDLPAKIHSLKTFSKPLLKKSSVLAGIIVVFFIVTKLFDFFLLSTGISNHPMSNRNPLWKFVVGLNYDEKGLYNKSDDYLVSKYPLGEERNNAERKIIQERIKDKKKLLTLMQAKFRIFWSDFDHALTNYVRPGTDLTIFKTNVLLYMEKCYYSIITLFVLLSLAFLFFSRKMSTNHTLYLILILGFMFIHFFIEIQLRYRYLVLPSFFIFSSFGIYSVAYQLGNLTAKGDTGSFTDNIPERPQQKSWKN